MGQRCRFNRRLISLRGHLDRAAQLAADLEHQLDLILLQCRFIHLRPGRDDDLAVLDGITMLPPQRLRDMRRGRVERAQQDAKSFAQHRGIGGGIGKLRAFKRVEHLHRARDHGVVLHAVKVVAHLAQQLVHLAAQIGGSGACTDPAGRAQALGILGRKGPQPAQVAERALGARIRPGRTLIGRGGKHREQACRIGTKLGNDVARFDHVVL